MDFKELFQLAGKTGEFPFVEVDQPIRHFPNRKGQIKLIRPDGVAVDLGGGLHKWFYSEPSDDKRSHYMHELKLCEK